MDKVTNKDSLYYSTGSTENAVGSMYSEPAKDRYINMSSYIKGAGVGIFPYRISFIAVKQSGVSHYFSEPQAMQIDVTEFGDRREYITASFTGRMSKDFGNYATVSGKFRIRY